MLSMQLSFLLIACIAGVYALPSRVFRKAQWDSSWEPLKETSHYAELKDFNDTEAEEMYPPIIGDSPVNLDANDTSEVDETAPFQPFPVYPETQPAVIDPYVPQIEERPVLTGALDTIRNAQRPLPFPIVPSYGEDDEEHPLSVRQVATGYNHASPVEVSALDDIYDSDAMDEDENLGSAVYPEQPSSQYVPQYAENPAPVDSYNSQSYNPYSEAQDEEYEQDTDSSDGYNYKRRVRQIGSSYPTYDSQGSAQPVQPDHSSGVLTRPYLRPPILEEMDSTSDNETLAEVQVEDNPFSSILENLPQNKPSDETIAVGYESTVPETKPYEEIHSDNTNPLNLNSDENLPGQSYFSSLFEPDVESSNVEPNPEPEETDINSDSDSDTDDPFAYRRKRQVSSSQSEYPSDTTGFYNRPYNRPLSDLLNTHFSQSSSIDDKNPNSDNTTSEEYDIDALPLQFDEGEEKHHDQRQTEEGYVIPNPSDPQIEETPLIPDTFIPQIEEQPTFPDPSIPQIEEQPTFPDPSVPQIEEQPIFPDPSVPQIEEQPTFPDPSVPQIEEQLIFPDSPIPQIEEQPSYPNPLVPQIEEQPQYPSLSQPQLEVQNTDESSDPATSDFNVNYQVK